MTLAGVMVEREAPVIEVADELGPLVVEVGQRFAGEGARRDLGQGLRKPGVKRIGDGLGLDLALDMAGLGVEVLECRLYPIKPGDAVERLLGRAGFSVLALASVGFVECSPGMGEAADESDFGGLGGDGAIDIQVVALQVAAVAFQQVGGGLLSQ